MWMGLKSPLRPAKLTTSVSVTVRPSDSHSWPTCTSSKNRCADVNDMVNPPGLNRTPSPEAAYSDSPGRAQDRGVRFRPLFHPGQMSNSPGRPVAGRENGEAASGSAGQERFGAALRAGRVNADADHLGLGDL